MTNPTPDALVTAEQAAALLGFYRRFKCVIPQDKAEEDASAALRTVIDLTERLADETARAVAAEALLKSTLDREAATTSRYDARLDAAEARVAVRVKPLVWEYTPKHGVQHAYHYAELPLSHFGLHITERPDGFCMSGKRELFATLEAAKAAAQADYEAHVRAALETETAND